MCEIAILTPQQYSVAELTDAAMKIYQAMRDSLGMVAVYDCDETFEYSIFKDTDPDNKFVNEFIIDHYDGASAIIIHGRLATAGAVTTEHTHPLEIECAECDIDYVIHNGVIRQHRQARNEHQRQGHTYNTEVDSEVIAHEHEQIPNGFDDDSYTTPIPGQPAYILLGSERIYMQSSKRYQMSEKGRMAKYQRLFGPDPREQNYREVIMHPSGADK